MQTQILGYNADSVLFSRDSTNNYLELSNLDKKLAILHKKQNAIQCLYLIDLLKYKQADALHLCSYAVHFLEMYFCLNILI